MDIFWKISRRERSFFSLFTMRWYWSMRWVIKMECRPIDIIWLIKDRRDNVGIFCDNCVTSLKGQRGSLRVCPSFLSFPSMLICMLPCAHTTKQRRVVTDSRKEIENQNVLNIQRLCSFPHPHQPTLLAADSYIFCLLLFCVCGLPKNFICFVCLFYFVSPPCKAHPTWQCYFLQFFHFLSTNGAARIVGRAETLLSDSQSGARSDSAVRRCANCRVDSETRRARASYFGNFHEGS